MAIRYPFFLVVSAPPDHIHPQSILVVPFALWIHSANPASIIAFMDRGSRLVGIYFFFVSRPQLIMSFFSLIIVGSCIYYLEIFVAFLLHEKSKSLKRKTRHSSRAKYHGHLMLNVYSGVRGLASSLTHLPRADRPAQRAAPNA